MRPFWWAIIGSIMLVLYGIVPCFQTEIGDSNGTSQFARVYAVYGGYFIILALLFGWVIDKKKPDLGDFVGASVSIIGAFIIFFWPRSKE
mmetsp:Transcript_9179/g.13788  ORF Transcript_9179/g.13788 Transcript_9179/m.13788 type:complete len:90 (+) Transcript_9179:92-361(+)